MISFTPYSPSNDEPDDLLGAGLAGPTPSGVTIGEVSYVGEKGQSSTFTGGDGAIGIDRGFLLTTGDGTPPALNTGPNATVSYGTPGDDDLTKVVEAAFPNAGGTIDANVLEFVVFVDNPDVEGISFDLVFGSDEYPEYVESYVDIAGVFVNGENVAYFDDDQQRPLSVISANSEYFIDNDDTTESPPGSADLPIEYDGVSIKLQASAPLKQGENVIKIAIADTGDTAVDSGLFVGNIRFVGDVGGGGLNVPPVAANDAYILQEDKTLVVSGTGVLGNDSDFDGDPLKAVLVQGPAHGTLVLNEDGTFTYTPDADFYGTDKFVYGAVDPKGGQDLGSVTLTVKPVADPPAAVDDAYQVAAGIPLTVTAANGVLHNDSDPDGGSLSAALLAGPAHGVLALNANGSFTYTPGAGFAGQDSFTYEAVDPQGNRTPATVVIDVTSEGVPPVIESVDVAGGEREGDLVTFTVLASDADEQKGLTYAFDFDGDGVADVTNKTGAASHAFADDGLKTVIVTVTDSSGNADVETVELAVDNVAPVITLDAKPPVVDGSTVTFKGTIADPGTADTFEVVIDWGEKGPGRFQTLTFNASPTGTQNFTVSHTFADGSIGGQPNSYTIKATATDDDGGKDVDVVGVTVENNAPVVTLNPVAAINENGVAVLTGTVGDRDPGETLTLKVDWGDGTGLQTLVLDDAGSSSTFRLTHTYRDDQPGGLADQYEITATLRDGRGGADEATRTAAVRNVAPSLDGGTSAEIPGGGPVSYSRNVGFSGAFSDAGRLDTHDVTIDWGDGTSISSVKNPNAFQMTPDGEGGARFKAAHNYGSGGIYRIATAVADDDGGRDVTRERIFVSGMRLDEHRSEIQIIADRGASNAYLFTDRGAIEGKGAEGAAPAGNNLIVVNTDILGQTNGVYDREAVERVYFRGSEARDVFVMQDGIADETLIDGRGGSDDLRGGSSRDHIKGGNGTDLLFGQLGRDTIDGGLGSDEIFGDFDSPSIGASDVLSGKRGNDTIIGGGGGDDISGDMGRDWLAGGFGQDTVKGGAGSDVMFGDEDTFLPLSEPLEGREGGPSALRLLPGEAVPNVVSRAGDAGDVMDGGAGNDLMFGQGGNDDMTGGSGNDTLVGGLGDDTLRLGGGRDLIVFDAGDGRDTVFGFSVASGDAIDLTELDRAAISDGGDVLDRARQVGQDVLIELGGEDQILLVDVRLTSLTEDVFLL